MDQNSVIRRVASAASRALRPALSTTRFLVAVMVPVSLGVLILDHLGILRSVSVILRPLMGLLGLPGEAALVFITALLLNIYSAIAVIGSLNLSGRDIVILASMCLIAHNLIVESTVMHKTGSSAGKMVLLRIGTALAAGWLLNLLLPATFASAAAAIGGGTQEAAFSWDRFIAGLGVWALNSGWLLLKVAVIVTVLMAAQKIMEEFGVMIWLGKATAPLMIVLGLPSGAGFLWIVANLVGLAYGSAIMIERAESGKMSLSDGDLFNHHAGISHSLLEDTLLFAAIGVPFFWAMIPRLVLAVLVVWLERGRRVLFRRSFRIGTV